MRRNNLLCASLAFLMILVAAYFGASIYNSKANNPISYLNEMDHIYHYDVKLIPKLNFQAAVFTLPLVLIILFTEMFIVLKAKVRQVKNIAIGLSIATLIILTVALLTVSNPDSYDFNKWGYVWICMGVFIVAGNLLSIFIKGNSSK